MLSSAAVGDNFRGLDILQEIMQEAAPGTRYTTISPTAYLDKVIEFARIDPSGSAEAINMAEFGGLRLLDEVIAEQETQRGQNGKSAKTIKHLDGVRTNLVGEYAALGTVFAYTSLGDDEKRYVGLELLESLLPGPLGGSRPSSAAKQEVPVVSRPLPSIQKPAANVEPVVTADSRDAKPAIPSDDHRQLPPLSKRQSQQPVDASDYCYTRRSQGQGLMTVFSTALKQTGTSDFLGLQLLHDAALMKRAMTPHWMVKIPNKSRLCMRTPMPPPRTAEQSHSRTMPALELKHFNADEDHDDHNPFLDTMNSLAQAIDRGKRKGTASKIAKKTVLLQRELDYLNTVRTERHGHLVARESPRKKLMASTIPHGTADAMPSAASTARSPKSRERTTGGSDGPYLPDIFDAQPNIGRRRFVRDMALRFYGAAPGRRVNYRSKYHGML